MLAEIYGRYIIVLIITASGLTIGIGTTDIEDIIESLYNRLGII